MSIFDSLPVVNQCCVCINLKLGCIFIAFCGILSFGNSTYLLTHPICGSSEDIWPLMLKIIGYGLLITDIFSFFASIVFLVGIFVRKKITAVIFLYSIASLILVYTIFIVFSVVSVIKDAECREYWPTTSLVMCTLIWVYFMIVVRSYKEEMV